MAKVSIGHAKAGSTPSQTDAVLRVPAARYLDRDRWEREVAFFRRTPLMLALGGELRGPNSFKAVTVMNTPVLLVRGPDLQVRAFVNSCSHRGAQVVDEGHGVSRRFACPYHNWIYDTLGAAVGIADREWFGDVDLDELALTPLPCAERAGLVFVVLTPGAPMDIDAHLHGYDRVLDFFGFGDWHLISQRELVGPNWKIAYDGYLDFYHLPYLHRASFGPNISNKATYTAWGPHQRVLQPDPALIQLEDLPEDDWNLDAVAGGVWTIFPHVSFAGGAGGGLVSQLFPGDSPGTSVTIQNYFVAAEPDEAQRADALKKADFLEHVVRDEDYRTGIRQQRALETGARSEVLFGRLEGGGQTFHRLLDQYLGEAPVGR
jgi:phenylpropionate dioxygenase-like ring-hydroxylating dioxygenase large terminal subunit